MVNFFLVFSSLFALCIDSGFPYLCVKKLKCNFCATTIVSFFISKNAEKKPCPLGWGAFSNFLYTFYGIKV